MSTLRKLEDDLYTDLTESQEKVLDFIEDCIVKEGLPPTLAEIQAHCGWKSRMAAHYSLRALARKGRIEIIQGKRRGIKLVQA